MMNTIPAVMMKTITAVAVATIITSPAIAQSSVRDAGGFNKTARGHTPVTQMQGQRRGAYARVPNSGQSADSNYWYERNREEFRGRW